MMMPDSQSSQIDGQEDPADFSLIHVSASDDDFLMASASGNPGDFGAEGSYTNQPSHPVGLPLPGKKGKCNLRKSLAWDSAFFTNAGVLDADELSSIIEGAETSVKQKFLLPGIEEDVSKSYDSVSTFESDSLTLESLEADLFCDVRASIQKTSRSSAQGNCTATKLLEEAETANGYLKKAVEISPRNVVKPKLATKKLNPSVQPPSTILKPRIVSKQIGKPPVRSKESKPLFHRPPEAAVKPSSIGAAATKKTPVTVSRAKLESNTSGIPKGKVASFSKVSYQADSSKTVPKAPASSKLSSGSSVLGRGAATSSSRSSCDSSSSTSSGTIRKFASDINQRKTDKNVALAPGSKLRAPSRVAVKSKSSSGDCHLSDYLKSTSQPSSISPTSSISEWSTESSSSTATINLYTGLLNQSKKQPSTESDVSLSRPSSAKPSGLRMPSATIGFFDGVKAAAKTPSGSSRSRSVLPSSLPRSGALNNTLSGTSGKPKAVVKSDSRRNVSNLKPVSLYDQSAGVPKTLNAENVDGVFEITSKVSEIDLRDSVSEATSKIMNGGKHVADFGSEAIEGISLVPAKKQESPKEKLHSSTSEATIAVEDLGNVMHIPDCVGDLTESPFSKESQSNRKEHSGIENANTLSETSSKVLVPDPALEENKELLNEGKHAADSSSEATRDVNLVVAKKEASPDVSTNLVVAKNEASPDVNMNLVVVKKEASPDVNMNLVVAKKEASPDVNMNLVVAKKEASPDVNMDLVVAKKEASPDVNMDLVVAKKEASPDVNMDLVVAKKEASPDVNMDLVVAKKEVSPDVNLQSSTDQTTIIAEDVGNSMHINNCVEDVTESPLSKGGQRTRKEHSDIQNADTVSKTSIVSESVVLDQALEGNLEILNGDKHAVGFSSEVTKNGNLVEAKKEASPEGNLHSRTNHAEIAEQDVSNAMNVTDCIEDPIVIPSSLERGSNKKEHSDVESIDTISETSSKFSDSVLLYLAFEDICELLYEERNYADSCSEATKEINLVEGKNEANPEVNLHSSTIHPTIVLQDVSSCITDCIKDQFYEEGGSNKKEHSDVEIVNTISETSSKIWELLYEGKNDVDSCSEASKEGNLAEAKREASPKVNFHSPINHAAIALQDVSNVMHVTDCIEDPSESAFSPEGGSNRIEHSETASVDTISETLSKVPDSILLDFSFEEILELIYDGRILDLVFDEFFLEVLNEGRNDADSCSEAKKDIDLVVAKKEATPEVNLQSSTNHPTILLQDVFNAMDVTDCMEDPSESPFSPEGGSIRKEHNDVESVDNISETSSEVSESVLLDLAFKENLELLCEGRNDVDSSSEATNGINMVEAKKEASPEVNMLSPTNHAAIAVQDVSNDTDCTEDSTESPFSTEGGSNTKEHSDVESIGSNSETPSNVSKSILLDLAFQEISELLYEGRILDLAFNEIREVVYEAKNDADSCSEATKDIDLVVAKKEATPEVNLQSSTNHPTILLQDVFNAMDVTDCMEDPSESPFSPEGGSIRKEHNDVESVDNISETSSEVSESVLLDLAFKENLELLCEGRNDVDSSSEATNGINMVEAKKEASPEVNMLSPTNHAAIAVQDVSNDTDCTEDSTESPFSTEGGSNTKEHSDVESIGSNSETPSNVSKSILLDLAFQEISELLYEGRILDLAFNEIREVVYEAKNDADSCSEATKYINVVEPKKGATPEVNLHSSTNHAAIALQGVSNAMDVTDCIEGPSKTPFSPEGGSSRKGHTDVERVDTISEKYSEVSESVLLDLCFQEDLELCEGRNVDGSCSEATKDTKKEASPEVALQDASNSMHVTDCTEDPTEGQFSPEGRNNMKEHSDVESMDTISETSSKVSESILLDVAFEEIRELLHEGRILDLAFEETLKLVYDGRNDADSCSQSTKDGTHAAIALQEVSDAIEAGQNITAEKQVEDPIGSHPETKNNDMKSNGKFQSQNLLADEENSSFILACPKELCTVEGVQSINSIPDSVSLLSPETRTPFTIKNSVADLIKAYNKSAEPPVRELVKLETLCSLEKGQEENC